MLNPKEADGLTTLFLKFFFAQIERFFTLTTVIDLSNMFDCPTLTFVLNDLTKVTFIHLRSLPQSKPCELIR